MKKLFSGLLLACIIFTLNSCDTGLRYIKIDIAKYPNKITYIAEKDSELDLSGCEIKRTTKEGAENTISVVDEGYSIKTGIKSTEIIEFDPYKTFEVHHSIDFNVPGVYEVDIILVSGIWCSYAIEVITL